MEMEGISQANKLKGMETQADLKSFPATNNISASGRFYYLILEGDLRFEDVVGPDSLDNLSRKEFVVRFEHVDRLLSPGGKKIKSIQKTTGATIAIISYPGGRPHHQARLELWGTHEQVEIAELLVVKTINEMYPKSWVHTVLMHPPIHSTEVYVPSVYNGVGVDYGYKVINMEAQYGAWIVVDSLVVPRCGSQCVPQRVQRITIYGSCAQIYRVLVMVHKDLLKPCIPVETEDQAYAMLEDENQLHTEAYVPLGQVSDSLLGASFCKVKEMEAYSGAQIVVDSDPHTLEDPGEGHLRMIRLKIYGSRAQIYQVLTMVHKAILEPYIPEDQDPAKLEDENKQHHDSEHIEAKVTIDLFAAMKQQEQRQRIRNMPK